MDKEKIKNFMRERGNLEAHVYRVSDAFKDIRANGPAGLGFFEKEVKALTVKLNLMIKAFGTKETF